MLKLAPTTPKLPYWRLQFDGWAQQLLIEETPVDISKYVLKKAMPSLDSVGNLLGILVGEEELGEKTQLAIDQSKELICDLPEEVLAFFKLNQVGEISLALFLKQVSAIQASPFHLIVESPWVKKFPYAFPVLSPEKWLPASKRIKNALLLPQSIASMKAWEKAGDFLSKAPFTLRTIPELDLIYQWDGVETLYYLPGSTSSQGWRGIKGFEATGGEIISIE